MSDDREWVNAWPLAKTLWSDCCIGFDCVCGEGELVISEPGEPTTCLTCGRIYRLGMLFQMREAS